MALVTTAKRRAIAPAYCRAASSKAPAPMKKPPVSLFRRATPREVRMNWRILVPQAEYTAVETNSEAR